MPVNDHIVLVTGDAPLTTPSIAAVPSSATVLGVDAGLDHALAAGLRPTMLIGDLDSISAEGLAWAEQHATILRHPKDKDQTDTELAIAVAADMGTRRLTMIGGGNRIDHSIAAIGALGFAATAQIERVDAWWSGQHLDVLHGPRSQTLHLQPETELSLIVLGSPCAGVSITGVRWPLDDVRLGPVTGLGVSNRVTSPDGRVTVTVQTGVLTIFNHPTPSDGQGAS